MLLSSGLKIFTTITLLVVVCGCETWYLALRREYRPRILDNRAMRKVFGPKKDEVTRDWRKFHCEDLHYLYSSPNIIRVIKSGMRWEQHVACVVEIRSAYRVLVGKHDGKRPLGRPRHRWEGNIKNGSSRTRMGTTTGLIWLRAGT